MRRAAIPQVAVVPALLAVIVFAIDMLSPSGMTADSLRQVSTAVDLVHHHTIGLDPVWHYQVNPQVGVTFVHHHVYPYFPWGGALFAVPWVIVYDIAHKLGIGPGSIALVKQGHDWPIQVISMSTVVALTTVVVYLIALRMLEIQPVSRRRGWAAVIALGFAFCTPAWPIASRSLWEHGPSMLFLSLALLFALRARQGERGWTGMGVALGCSYAMRPTDAIPIAVLGLWVLGWQRRHALKVIVGAVPPLAILFTVDWVAYRQLLTPYYTQGQGFQISSTFRTALAGNLVSPGRGLFIYVPLVALSAWGLWILHRSGRLDPFWIAVACVPVVHWIVISAFKHWWAGDSYGNRLFTDMMPFFVLLAMPAFEHLASRPLRTQRVATSFVSVAVVWCLFVQGQGATLRSAWCWNNEPTDVDVHSSKVWSWSDPQFLRGVRRIVWGPNRHSELIRDGVDKIGCPVEPVRP
ncbi:MAG TPA: hypothetical protein VFZ97_13665 [Acidimicrobiales bacterium]